MASTRKVELESTTCETKSSPEEIRSELSRILDSNEFKATPRRRDMLRYLVEESLAGRALALKGYTIGVSVFGRDDDFDPQADPVVRLEARRLRRDLDSYYVSAGRNNPVRISIPKGHYIPETTRSGTYPDEGPPADPDGTRDHDQPHGSGSTVAARRTAIKGLWWISGVAVATLLIAIFLAYTLVGRGNESARAMAQGPAVMVIPFKALGISEQNTFLAAGIADQIMTELSRFPDFRLYSPSGVATGPDADPLKQGRQLGLSYIVEGNVTSDKDSVRIGTNLIEVQSGRIVWAEDYRRPLQPGSLLQVQTEIASDVATALGQPYGIILSDVATGLSDDFRPSMSSYECVLRAYSYRRSFSRALHAPVVDCLEQAVGRDPEYAEAWALLGWLYMDGARFGWAPQDDVERTFAKALEASEHALLLDVNNVMALKALGSIHHYMGNYSESVRFQRQALSINPNDPDTLAQLGWRLAIRGHFDEGIPYVEKAIARTVNPPGWYYHLIAIDHYMHGRYDDMLAAAKYGTGHESGISWSLVAIAQGALGDRTAARDALEKMEEISPQLGRDPAGVYRTHQATEEIVEMIVSGLRNAGWNEPGA